MKNPWNVATVEQVEYSEAHPEGKTDIFIQWKGTDVCFDFHCECGQQSHYDGYFAYSIQCPACGVRVIMPSTIYPLKVEDSAAGTYDHESVVPEP